MKAEISTAITVISKDKYNISINSGSNEKISSKASKNELVI